MRLGDIAQAAARAFTSFKGEAFDGHAAARVAEQLGQWVSHFSRNAALRWTPNILNPCLCSFCEEDAVTDCIACKDPICMAHGHISFRAEGICDECVEKALRQAPGKKKTRAPGTRERSPRPSPRAAMSPDLEHAFAILGVPSSSSWADVQTAYKALALSNHPDRFPDSNRKRQAEIALRNFNAAFGLLKTHFERAA